MTGSISASARPPWRCTSSPEPCEASTTEQLRLFVALELPEPVRDALVEWQRSVVGEVGELRAVGREALHVTLCFLGAVPSGSVEAVAEACSVVAGRAVRQLSVLGPVWLPRRRPRVLSVGLDDQLGELASVQAALSAALADAGVFRPERRAFLPHVTVARVRSGGREPSGGRDGRERGGRPRVRELDPPGGGVFDADWVTLYRSHLGGGPARYEPLHRAPLSRR